MVGLCLEVGVVVMEGFEMASGCGVSCTVQNIDSYLFVIKMLSLENRTSKPVQKRILIRCLCYVTFTSVLIQTSSSKPLGLCFANSTDLLGHNVASEYCC